MPDIIGEFQDIANCRGETEESLKKRFGISPFKDSNSLRIILKNKLLYYSQEDILKVLSIWRDAAFEYKNHAPSDAHFYSISWKDLRKSVRR